MPEIIRSIEEHETSCQEGYRIVTNDQEVLLLIDKFQNCCEDWGYFMSEDDTTKFVGAELRGIEIVDTARDTRELPELGLDEGEAMFVDIKTNLGTLQFVAYNAHNGYYGHDATVQSKQLTHTECL